MIIRSILAGTALFTSALSASAEDAKAPCEVMAQYLRAFANSHPDQAVDTGSFEFLNNATHLADGQSDDNAPVSGIAVKSFETLEAALASVSNAKLDDTGRTVLSDNELLNESETDVEDFRPFANQVIVSQTQGTLHCDKVAVFRIESGVLAPSSSVPDDPSELCYGATLIGMRIHQTVYPAISEGGDDAKYSILLLRPDEKAMREENSVCKVALSFATKPVVTDWDGRGATATSPSPARLRSILEPLLVSENPSAGLKTLEPRPDGNSPYDGFLHAADRKSQSALEAVDPHGRLLDESYADAAPFLGAIDFYPIGIDGHRLILVWGEPIGGYRMVDYSAIAVWEWTEKGLVPLVSGSLGIRGTNPTIAAE